VFALTFVRVAMRWIPIDHGFHDRQPALHGDVPRRADRAFTGIDRVRMRHGNLVHQRYPLTQRGMIGNPCKYLFR